MPSSILVRRIIEQALATSLRNRPGAIANEPIELSLVINRTLTEAFMDASAIFPEYFGVEQTAIFEGFGGWQRPQYAFAVYRLESATLGEVGIVFDRDRSADRLRPTVIERSQQYFPNPASPVGPTGGNLTVYFSRKPQVVVENALDSYIDGDFPDEFAPLLVYGLATYLATKDNRQDDILRCSAEYDSWRALWRGYLTNATLNPRLRYSPRSSPTKAQSTVTPEPL